MGKMYETPAFALPSKDGKFERITIKRNEPGPDDVEFDIKYCGICHTDVHFAWNDLGNTIYPIVPGHELAGIVTKVGKNVKKFKVGDHVGVGCIVDSCLNCKSCKAGDEVGCEKKFTNTYNDQTRYGRLATDSGYTYGGYSGRTTINKNFAIKIPSSYPLEAAGPVFCAGITMYSPMKQFGAAKGGKRVGIIGIGGLGQMGVRIAAALGNEVTAISTSPKKEKVAKEIGAKHFVVSTDPKSMEAAAQSLDLILNTVSADHQASHYLPLLARHGNLVQLGVNPKPHAISQLDLIFNGISLSGSLIGSIVDTQEVTDLCAKKKIVAATELITWEKLGEVYKTLSSGNDRVVRYVLDMDKSLGKK